jgi:hypothetical protein
MTKSSYNGLKTESFTKSGNKDKSHNVRKQNSNQNHLALPIKTDKSQKPFKKLKKANLS